MACAITLHDGDGLGISKQAVQNALSRQRNVAPKRVQFSSEDNVVKRLEHVDLLSWCMTAGIFVDNHLFGVLLHMEITSINREVGFFDIERDLTSIVRQYKIRNDDIAFGAADVCPLLVSCNKGTVETAR